MISRIYTLEFYEDEEGHAHGDRIVLLLGGYDKGERPSARYQQGQIELARTRLKAWKARQEC